jgi:hypothetical protein
VASAVRRPRLPPLPVWLLGAIAAGDAACSLIAAPTGEQCATTADCAARGAKFANTECQNKVCVAKPAATDAGIDSGPVDPKWACLGKVRAETPKKSTVKVSVPLRDLTTRGPVVQMSCRLCAKVDPDCATPIAGPVSPSPDGIVAFDVSASFDGYVEAKAPVPDGGTLPSYVPSLVFFNPPLVDDTVYIAVPLVSYTVLATLAQQTGGSTIDPALGGALFEAHDCKGTATDGVTATIDTSADTTRRFFFVNGLPNEAAKGTDGTGYGGFINAPPGVRTVTGDRVDGKGKLGTISVLVRKGYLSYSVLPPLP